MLGALHHRDEHGGAMNNDSTSWGFKQALPSLLAAARKARQIVLAQLSATH